METRVQTCWGNSRKRGIKSCHEQYNQDEVDIAHKMMEDAKELAINFDQRRQTLTGQRESLTEELEQARMQERHARDERQAKQIELERSQSSLAGLVESIARLSQQLEGQAARRAELASILENDDDPAEGLREQLQTLLENRLSVERELSKARNDLSGFENQMQNADQARLSFDRKSRTVRDSLEQVRMGRQEVLVRRNTIAEEMQRDESEMLLAQQALPEEFELSQVEQMLADVVRKVERIGAVNLMAIDEFDCLLYTSPSPRDLSTSRMPSSA